MGKVMLELPFSISSWGFTLRHINGLGARMHPWHSWCVNKKEWTRFFGLWCFVVVIYGVPFPYFLCLEVEFCLSFFACIY